MGAFDSVRILSSTTTAENAQTANTCKCGTWKMTYREWKLHLFRTQGHYALCRRFYAVCLNTAKHCKKTQMRCGDGSKCGLGLGLLSTHADRQGVDISVTVCVFVRLRISPPSIKLAESYFARRFIGVQGRESPIFGNFAPTEAQNRIKRPARGPRTSACKHHRRDAPT